MRIWAAFAGLCLLASPTLAREAGPLAASEVVKLSDEQLARRIFGPLASNLFVSNRPRETNALQRSWDVWFWTRAHEDSLNPGICETTRIIVRLERGLGGTRNDPVLMLRGIETQSAFIIQNRAFADRGFGFEPKELEGLEAACQALDPGRDAIPADNSWQLMKAIEFANQLGTAARAGRAPVPIDCTRIHFSAPPPSSEAECLKEISSLSERTVYSVTSCGQGPLAGGDCIRIQSDDWFIYVQLDSAQNMTRVAIEGVEDTNAIV
jgi:hypothetical protein